MADQPTQKTLEMRVAELEDKLSKLHISEEDMKTYHRVSAALGGGATALTPQVCHIVPTAGCVRWQPGCWSECVRWGGWGGPITASCQPCAVFQGGSGGGGFGTLGS